jgi:PAS domain S-box-containing protein
MLLVREGLRGTVRVAVHRCAAEHGAVTILDGWLEVAEGRFARVAVTASPVGLDDPDQPEFFVISFEQLDETRGSPPGDGNGDGDGATSAETETETELRRMRDELQTTIEELQTSNEELKASHEEVTSINEELQSSNEELETSKEEMQSLNEELTTVNAQLNSKMEELQSASNDLSALLTSTTIAVLFLDPHSRIRRFTPAVRELLDVINSDIGRPLADLKPKFEDPHLLVDAQLVLERLVPVEREVQAENGRYYVRRVLPYRTTDNRIDGVVVTFIDITARRHAEREATESQAYAHSIVATLHEPLLVLHADLTVRSANPAFYQHFKVAPGDTKGRKIYDLGNGQWNIPALRTLLEEVLPANKAFNDYEVSHDFETLGHRVMLLNGRQLDHEQLILLGVRDVTEQHAARRALREREERLQRLTSVQGIGILMFDISTGVLIDANDAFLEMSGYTREQVAARELNWHRMTPPAYTGESERQIKLLAETGRVGPYEKEYLRADGSRSLLLFAGAALGDGTGVEYCVELGSRVRLDERIRASEERFRLVVDDVKDYGIFMADAAGVITSWNPGAEHVFGYSRDEAVGMDARVLFTPEDQATGEHEKELELARQEGRASDDRWQIRKGGERFWAAGVTSAMRDAADNVVGFIKILRDETQRKQSEQQLKQDNEALEKRVAQRTTTMATHQRQLRSLVAELGRSEILQRRMLATELHDNLAQLLAACKLKVSSIEAQLPETSKSRQDAAVVKESLGEAISYTRTLMTDLRPDVLDEHDLPAAIEWVAKRMARHGLKVEVVDDGKPKPLHEDLLGFLFQAVRELLWNVVKHGRTAEAQVTLERPDHTLRVVVEDKGIGFNTGKRAAPTEEGGYGLFSIGERVDLLGGRMEVESGRRRGTRVTLTVPLDAEVDGGETRK